MSRAKSHASGFPPSASSMGWVALHFSPSPLPADKRRIASSSRLLFGSELCEPGGQLALTTRLARHRQCAIVSNADGHRLRPVFLRRCV